MGGWVSEELIGVVVVGFVGLICARLQLGICSYIFKHTATTNTHNHTHECTHTHIQDLPAPPMPVCLGTRQKLQEHVAAERNRCGRSWPHGSAKTNGKQNRNLERNLQHCAQQWPRPKGNDTTHVV